MQKEGYFFGYWKGRDKIIIINIPLYLFVYEKLCKDVHQTVNNILNRWEIEGMRNWNFLIFLFTILYLA